MTGSAYENMSTRGGNEDNETAHFNVVVDVTHGCE